MKTIKNSFKVILAGALTVLALSASANDDFFKLEIVKEKVFSLTVENVNKNASITILDEEGTRLYNESLNAQGRVIKNFDITSFPQGEYELVYSDDFKVQSVSMTINEEISFQMDLVQFVPVIVNDGSQVKVGLLSNNRTKMNISVYDLNNRLLVSEVIQGDQYLGKQYDFSKVRKGTYKVVVSTNGRTYAKTIKI